MKSCIMVITAMLISGCVDPNFDTAQSSHTDDLVDDVLPEEEHLVGQRIVERTYDVSGDSIKDLHANMLELGPRDMNDGQPMFAQTSSWFTFDWKLKGCSLDRVFVDTEIVMPSYVGPRSAAATAFDELRSAMELHERRHAKIAKRYAVKIAKAVISKSAILPKEMLKSRSCEAFESAVQPVIDELTEEFKLANVQYDTLTQHGFTEGVCWSCR